MSVTVDGNLTSIDMSDYFSPHPMPYTNYTAKIIVVNSEGNSLPTVTDGKFVY